MKSKNILLAGLAVGVLAAATGAQALNLSGSTVGGVAVTGNPAAASVNPYLVASEVTIPAAGLNGVASFDAHLTTGNITSGTFLVTYSLTGATFNTTGITNANLTYLGAVGGTNATVSTLTSTSVSFIVTVQGAASLTDFVLAGTGGSKIINVAAAGPVVVTASITAGGLPVDNGPAAGTVINFTQGYASTIGTPSTATNQVASIASGFKLFKTGGADSTTAVIGTVTTAQVPAPTTSAGAAIYKDLLGTQTSAGDIAGSTVNVTGTLGSTETVSVGATVVTPGTNTAVTGGGAQNVTLTQAAATVAGRAPLAPSSYSIVSTPTLNATGLNAGAAVPATLALGKVTYEGVNFNAAWVGDGVTNGSQDYRIRIGNAGGAINGNVLVSLLNPSITGTSGTVASTASCTIGTTIPANGSLTISSANLRTCFGAFGNSDLVVTIQASSSNLSAKMRVINTLNSVVTEQSLGFGVTFATLP